MKEPHAKVGFRRVRIRRTKYADLMYLYASFARTVTHLSHKFQCKKGRFIEYRYRLRIEMDNSSSGDFAAEANVDLITPSVFPRSARHCLNFARFNLSLTTSALGLTQTPLHSLSYSDCAYSVSLAAFSKDFEQTGQHLTNT